MNIKGKTIIIFLFFLSSHITGQELNTKDSFEVSKIVNGFFNWYVAAINDKIESEFQPSFIKGKDGMTTLEYGEYLENLEKHGFSNDLIVNEINSYSECLENIEKLKFEDFENQYTDIDQYELTNCDFSNYYRWTGGQEPVDGIRIESIDISDNFIVTVIIEYFTLDSENTKHFYGKNRIYLVKIESEWKINRIASNSY